MRGETMDDRDSDYEVLRRRIRHERGRTAGGDDRIYDPLIEDLSRELGEVVEWAMRLGVDRGQDRGLRMLEALASSNDPALKGGLGKTARLGLKLLTPSVSRTAGDVTTVAARWAMRAGFASLRELRRLLEPRR